jgi:hypothetical protein
VRAITEVMREGEYRPRQMRRAHRLDPRTLGDTRIMNKLILAAALAAIALGAGTAQAQPVIGSSPADITSAQPSVETAKFKFKYRYYRYHRYYYYYHKPYYCPYWKWKSGYCY